MGIRLTKQAWVAREVERVRGVLLQNMEKGREYTVKEILSLLSAMGLKYSNPEYTEIGQQLLAEGTVEVV